MVRSQRSLFAKDRERALWLVVVACLAAILWAVAQALAWPVPARVTLAGTAAAVGILIPEIRFRRAAADRRERLVGRVEVLSPGSMLPRVGETSLQQLRVHESRINVPYIGRDKESEVDAALSARCPVLIVGHSMAGKTRLAVARVAALFRDATLLAPLPGIALRELLDAGLNIDGMVVWLDDLDRYLTGESWLDPGLMDRMINAGARVVATIRRNALEVYRPRDDAHPAQWETLRRFTRVELARLLSNRERQQVETSISDLEARAAVERYGLAEYLGGGPDAVDRFEAGDSTCPVGAALVRAAVDWRRAGLVRLVSMADLQAALPIYLAGRQDIAIDEVSVEQALKWATEKINETVRLLVPYRPDPAEMDVFRAAAMGAHRDERLFEAFDYLVDLLAERTGSDDSSERDKAAIPEGMWALVARAAAQAEQGDDVALAAGAYFAGRSRVFANVAAWLAEPRAASFQLLAVTGAPGSGKSAVIRRLALLADPATRGLVPMNSWVPRLTIPAIDLVTSARIGTCADLIAEICDAASVPLQRTWGELEMKDALLRALAARDGPLNIVIDAIDEAAEPLKLARELVELAELAEGMLRVIVATRPHLMPYFSDAYVIDLDSELYRDPEDLVAFARHRLMSTPGSPYVNHESVVDRIAELVAQRSHGNFLVTKMVCDHLAARTDPLDTNHLEGLVPGNIQEAMQQLLTPLGPHELDTIALISALALGPVEGINADDWVAAASQLRQRSYDRSDLDRLVFQTGLRGIVTVVGPRQHHKYRLIHSAIRDYFAARARDLPG